MTASLDYWDLELPQDVCAGGRVQSFGKGSKLSMPQRAVCSRGGAWELRTGRSL